MSRMWPLGQTFQHLPNPANELTIKTTLVLMWFVHLSYDFFHLISMWYRLEHIWFKINSIINAEVLAYGQTCGGKRNTGWELLHYSFQLPAFVWNNISPFFSWLCSSGKNRMSFWCFQNTWHVFTKSKNFLRTFTEVFQAKPVPLQFAVYVPWHFFGGLL